MTFGNATDAIVILLQNTQKNEDKQLIAKHTHFKKHNYYNSENSSMVL